MDETLDDLLRQLAIAPPRRPPPRQSPALDAARDRFTTRPPAIDPNSMQSVAGQYAPRVRRGDLRPLPTRQEQEREYARLQQSPREAPAYQAPMNQFADAGNQIMEGTGLPSVRRSAAAFADNRPREGFEQGAMGALSLATLGVGGRSAMPGRARPMPRVPSIESELAPVLRNASSSDIDDLLALGGDEIPTPEAFLGRPLTPDHIWNDPRFQHRLAMTSDLEGVRTPADRFDIAGERIAQPQPSQQGGMYDDWLQMRREQRNALLHNERMRHEENPLFAAAGQEQPRGVSMDEILAATTPDGAASLELGLRRGLRGISADQPLLGTPDISADPMAAPRRPGQGALRPPQRQGPNEDRYLFGRPQGALRPPVRNPMRPEMPPIEARPAVADGFDTRTPYYHGIHGTVDAGPGAWDGGPLRVSPDGRYGDAVYLSPSRQWANEYATVLQRHGRADRAGDVVEAQVRGRFASERRYQAELDRADGDKAVAVERLRRAGFDGVRAPGENQIAVFDPANVRVTSPRPGAPDAGPSSGGGTVGPVASPRANDARSIMDAAGINTSAGGPVATMNGAMREMADLYPTLAAPQQRMVEQVFDELEGLFQDLQSYALRQGSVPGEFREVGPTALPRPVADGSPSPAGAQFSQGPIRPDLGANDRGALQRGGAVLRDDQFIDSAAGQGTMRPPQNAQEAVDRAMSPLPTRGAGVADSYSQSLQQYMQRGDWEGYSRTVDIAAEAGPLALVRTARALAEADPRYASRAADFESVNDLARAQDFLEFVRRANDPYFARQSEMAQRAARRDPNAPARGPSQ